jgi:uncharacterized protein (TIGR02246 family)
MSKNLLFIVIGLLTLSSALADENVLPDAEAQIVGVINSLIDAWREGDGEAWADAFAEDADFTVWFGLSLKGKEQIAWGHQLIFDSFYANTVFELGATQIRFLGDGVAIVHLQGSVLEAGQEPPAEPDAVPIAVLNRSDDTWKIVAFQNTPFVVNEFRMNGDLKRFKRLAAEQSKAP